MTDKQIIIDNVDVSGCEHFDNYDCYAHMDYSNCCEGYDAEKGYCPIIDDCYYKQLKRKEQECERLKNIIDEAKNSKLDLKSFLVGEAIQNEYEQQLDQLKIENERLKKGIFKLDKTQPQVILTEGQVSLMYCTFLDMELKTTKLKQTLAEIKAEMRKILMVGNGIDGEYRPVKNSSKQDCYQVLGKIQEILGTNQIKISEVNNENS